MRIAIVKKKYTTGRGGGAERYAAMVTETLASRGHELFVLAESFEADPVARITHIPVPAPTLSLPSSSGTMAFHRKLRRTLAGRGMRKGAFNGLRFDAVYALSRTFPSDVFRATEQIHAEWLNLRYSSAQKLNPRHRGILWLERKIYDPARTAAVVTNSQLAKRLIAANFPYPESRISVLRNGVDRRLFRPAADHDEKSALRRDLLLACGAEESAEDEILVLFASGNFRIKGLDYAIQAIRKAQDASGRQFRIFVVGGDKPGPYVKLAARLELWDRVHFLGDRRDMRSCYAAADLFLLPSLGEPFANVCLEACACALPVVTTVQNGSSELIQNGVNGFVAPAASNIDAIASSLATFAALSRERRDAFAAAAFAAAAPYSWETHVDALEVLLSDIAARNPLGFAP